MARAIDVARHFIRLAARESEPELLTNLRLQKLLYYAQGWSLAVRGRPIFDGPIQAWLWGPVVPEVYPHFAPGAEPISAEHANGESNLTPGDEAFVESVWLAYRQFSGTGLASKTHTESPWKEAWARRKEPDRGDEEISHETMADFFWGMYQRHSQCPIPREDVLRAESRSGEDLSISLDEALAELSEER